MRHRVDKAVVLLITADFADEEAGIENETGDDGSEENDAEQDLHVLLPVQNDPAETYGDGGRGTNYSDAQKECDFAAAANAHEEILARARDFTFFKGEANSLSSRKRDASE